MLVDVFVAAPCYDRTRRYAGEGVREAAKCLLLLVWLDYVHECAKFCSGPVEHNG